MSSERRYGFGRIDDVDPYAVASYTLYALGIVFFLFPVLWVLSMSLRPAGEVLSYPVQIIPRSIVVEPYLIVLQDSQMVTWFLNSLKITILEVIGVLLVVTPGAYAFSRFEFRGRRPLLFGVLFFQMISPVVIVIPMYNMMANFGLLNTHVGLILLYIGLQIPFSIWLLKSYFDTIPESLDKAAQIDGCNNLQTLWHVLIPVILPGLAVVVIFNFVFSWAEFVMAYTVLNSSKLFTVSIGIFSFQGQYSTSYRLIAAASIITIFPLLLMFLSLQKYFIKGLVEGAVKE